MNDRLSVRRAAATVLLAAGVALIACGAAKAAPPSQQQFSAEQLERLIERHRLASQPGPEHERLAEMQGAWDVEMRLWPEPGAEPMTTTGTMEGEMIVGGRFLLLTTDIAGTEATQEQIWIVGFDRRADEYTIMGMDVSGTYWVTARGPAGEDGSHAVLSGEDYDAIFDGVQLYDFVLSWPDDDTFVVEIIFKDQIHTRGGPPFKMAETTSRRRR